MMLADMTASNNELYDYALFEFDAAGIPYNIMVTPNGPSVEFPTVLTPGSIDDALSTAATKAN